MEPSLAAATAVPVGSTSILHALVGLGVGVALFLLVVAVVVVLCAGLFRLACPPKYLSPQTWVPRTKQTQPSAALAATKLALVPVLTPPSPPQPPTPPLPQPTAPTPAPQRLTAAPPPAPAVVLQGPDTIAVSLAETDSAAAIFEVQCRAAGGETWTTTGTALPLLVKGLPGFTQLLVTVRVKRFGAWTLFSEPTPVATRLPACVLAKYSVDWAAPAAVASSPHIVARDHELSQLCQVLCRFEKSNALLVGDSGCGKTALVKGFAARAAAGNVPAPLARAAVLALDYTALQAGCGSTGDLETRLRDIAADLQRHATHVVLFVDDLHTMLNTADHGGTTPIGHWLRTLLSMPLRCIATTTFAELKNLEKDAGFIRRFAVLRIAVLSTAACDAVLQARVSAWESHYRVQFDEDCVAAAIELSTKYLPDRRLPDKAIDVLNAAASAVAMEGGPVARVTPRHLATAISHMTGIPAARIHAVCSEDVDTMDQRLTARVVGQPHAVRAVCQAVRARAMGLADDSKPVGVFLFVGPTGVGKTELAKAIAEDVMGGDGCLTRLDMSEYQEQNAVATLLGAPPGYVGYGQGGTLTEALKRRPASVILLDEIEKANPRVLDVLLQVFDDGRVTTACGVTVPCNHAMFIMTGNLGQTAAEQHGLTPGERHAAYMNAITTTFRPEFVARIHGIFVFNRLDGQILHDIAEMHLQSFARRPFFVNNRLRLSWTPQVVAAVLATATRRAAGASGSSVRHLQRHIQECLVEPLVGISHIPRGGHAVLSATRDGAIKLNIQQEQ